MKKLLLLLIFLPSMAMGLEATYQVKFIGNFSKDIFKGDNFPKNPHFSPVNIVTHTKDYSLFPKGSLATPGVKDVAETGSPTQLTRELDAAQMVNTVLEYANSGPVDGDVAVSQTITVKGEAHYLSVITMIAPSPDWVVGINSLKLLRNGRFIKRAYAPLYAIDAGTDSGLDYTSPNLPTDPQRKIKRLKYINGKYVKKPHAFLLIQRIK